jgi:hypothetical protein
MGTKIIVADDTEAELIRVCGHACIAKEQLSHFTWINRSPGNYMISAKRQ